MFLLAAVPVRSRQQRFDQLPLLVGEVRRVERAVVS
jgi:hypothetical protein